MFERALLLGLSTGFYCIGNCFPSMISLLFCERPKNKMKFLKIIGHFNGGRFIAYLLTGLFVGYAGSKFGSNPFFSNITAFSLIFLSILMILHGIRTIKGKKCNCNSSQRKLPLIFGLFNGFNICPPFLIAIPYSFSLGSAFKGVMFFTVFFCVTTLYFLPFIFFNGLSKIENVQIVARMTTIMAGVFYFVTGIKHFMY